MPTEEIDGSFQIPTGGYPRRSEMEDHDSEAMLLIKARAALTKKMIQSALAGSVPMLKLCAQQLEALNEPIPFSLPILMSVQDLPEATAAIVDATMKGKIKPHVGVELAKLITIHANALRDVELGQRLAALEDENTR